MMAHPSPSLLILFPTGYLHVLEIEDASIDEMNEERHIAVPGGHRRQMAMTRHEWLKRIARRFGRRGVGRFGSPVGRTVCPGHYWSICVRNRHEPALGRSTYIVSPH